VQWVVPRSLCPPAQPVWIKASQAAVSTASQSRKSLQGLERNQPRLLRPLPEEWRTVVWILLVLALSLSMLTSPRQSPQSPR
ncbi:hypothetical protein ATANTOWER_027497, partial [Ataeniobius toweri]|nr:hypothetical protein [Ataeniobius toweri]